MREPDIERVISTGANQRIFRFKNGYGASVVCGPYTYGGPEGLSELAVLRFNGERIDKDYELAYDTGITNDVIGYLSEVEVESLLQQIAELE